MSVRKVWLALAGFWFGWITPLTESRADCTLHDLTDASLGPEIQEAVAGEIAAHPDRYLNGTGRFWSVADGSGEIKAHLYGTFHFPHGTTTWLPPAVHAAFARSTTLVVEVDGRALAEASRLLRARQAMDVGMPLTSVMERIAPGLLEPELRRYGISPGQAERAGPFALARRISGARCATQSQTLSSGLAIDLLLQESELPRGKTVRHLETAEEALGATGMNQP